MHEEFRDLLKVSHAGTLTGGRIAWGRRPQSRSQLPEILLTLVDFTPQYTLNGETTAAQSRVQVDCYADSYSDVTAVARAVVGFANGRRLTSGGVTFQKIAVEDYRDLTAIESDARRLFRVSVDLIVWLSTEI